MKYILTFLFIWAVLYSVAQIPSSKPNTYVNDWTRKLSREQVYALNDSILSLEKKSGVQIAIVLVNTLPPDMEIEDYARAIGKSWGVGNTKNGLVYVAAISQRKQRLEVAENLEGDIPDITAKAITDDIKPFFRDEKYYEGLANMIENIKSYVDPIAKEQKALLIKKEQERMDEAAVGMKSFLLWLVIVLVIGGIIVYIFYLSSEKRRKKEEEKEAEKMMAENRIREIASIERTRKASEDEWWAQKRELERMTGSSTITPTHTSYPRDYVPPKKKEKLDIITPIILSSTMTGNATTPPKKNDDDDYKSSSSSNDNSGSFGGWGSDSGSSGFSGGGSSNDW